MIAFSTWFSTSECGMLVFVDESGDPGTSGRGGATAHFVAGLVLL